MSLELQPDALGDSTMSKVKDPQNTVADALAHLSASDWADLREKSASNTRWCRLEWWHNKYYLHNPLNDGDALQIPWSKGDPEIPYRRQLFYPSLRSRFSLRQEGAVAYFSSDFGINCCETIEQFSNNLHLRFSELSQYLQGHGNPIPGHYGYPLNFHLAHDTLILDLSAPGAPFFKVLDARIGSPVSQAMWRIITSRTLRAKLATQLISLGAKNSLFDGLVYASVRAPVDVVMPTWNLVVFSPRKLRPGLPPNPALERTREVTAGHGHASLGTGRSTLER